MCSAAACCTPCCPCQADAKPCHTLPAPPAPTYPPRSGKLFAITTLMVLLVPASADVLTVPLARVLGVLGGVLLSALVSTFLLPTTASCQALQHMHAALCQLAQLAGGVWHSYAASLEAAGALGPGAMQAPAATAAAAPLGGRAAAPSEQAAVEGMLDGVLAAFKQAADSQAAARKEVFMGRAAAGRLLLWLPAWPWADSQRQLAPPALVAAVIAAGRACVRLLWMLHASQAEGFAPEQLRSLQGVHGQQLLEQLPRLADTAFQHTAVQLDAALQRMSGRGGDARQQQQQQQQQQWEDGDAAANSKPSWHGTAARGTAPQESSEPAPPERAAAAAVQALADAVDALIRGSRHNRAALYRELAALQAAAAGGSGSNPAGDAGGASGSTRATTEAATAAAAAAAAAHVAGYVTHNAAPLGTPRSSWHDAGSGAGIDGLLRWHSLEFILERLAQHAAELQAAVAALAAALPS